MIHIIYWEYYLFALIFFLVLTIRHFLFFLLYLRILHKYLINWLLSIIIKVNFVLFKLIYLTKLVKYFITPRIILHCLVTHFFINTKFQPVFFFPQIILNSFNTFFALTSYESNLKEIYMISFPLKIIFPLKKLFKYLNILKVR